LSKVALLLAGTVALFAIAPSANAESVGATNRAIVGPPFKPAAETRKAVAPPYKPTAETRKAIGPPFKPMAETRKAVAPPYKPTAASIGSPGSKVMLNPQPLPPRVR